MTNCGRWVFVALICSLGSGGTALAQAGAAGRSPATSKPAESTPLTDPTNPGLWNADRMMEDAVQTLVRRYNLNPEQTEYTRKLLTTKTKSFLKDHEAELRQLIRESIEMNIDKRKATPENYKAWAEKARPLFERAKKDILDGNKEWGDILNDTQKKIHDFDLAQMQGTFTQMDGLITKWSDGQYSPKDLSPRPPSAVAKGNDPQGHRLSDGPEVYVRKTEELWQLYVNQFIEVYQLTPEQRNAGYAILQDCRGRATGYRNGHKKEFDAVESQLKEASNTPTATARAIELREQQAELERPIQDIFSDLRQRLDQIPSKAQREGVTSAQIASLENLAKVSTPGTPVEKPTTVAPAGPTAKPTHERNATKHPNEPAKAPPTGSQPAKP